MLTPAQLRTVWLTFLLMSLTPGFAHGDDYDDGMAAYTAGQYSQALVTWTRIAINGNARAQFNLAYMYEFGIAVPPNSEEAVKWYQLSAELGYARAQNFLGWMYEMGKGVTHNRSEALKWLRMAADQGSNDAISDYRLVAKRLQRNQDLSYKEDFFELLYKQLGEAERRYEQQENRTPDPRRELEASNLTS